MSSYPSYYGYPSATGQESMNNNSNNNNNNNNNNNHDHNSHNYNDNNNHNHNLAPRRSILSRPGQNKFQSHHIHYDLNQPQNVYYTGEKENAEYNDMEAPKKYNNQKNKIASKSPLKWYRNTRTILQMFKSNFLLIFLPPAIIMKRFGVNENVLFFFNFLAIIPMAKIMTVGINDISARLHPAYAAVLHAFAGNFVELVISSYALMDKQYAIVRSSVLGAILCNILLILGIVFLAGSWPRKGSRRQSMNAHLTTQLFVSTSASTLALAVLALVTPAAFKIAAPAGTGIECDLQNISHATAIILLFVYAGLLVFQLKTHAQETVAHSEHHGREAQYFLIFDVFIIVASISGITVCARYLVTSIEHMAHSFHLGNGFIGMVLLPLCVVSNFMEHYDAIKEASEDKVDTAVSLILNTSVQIALLVTPILVLVGWITSRPLTLDFNTLEICVLACAVLIVNYLVADGKANWLEGYMLIVSYIIIAVAFFYFPNVPELKENLNCNPWSRNLPPEFLEPASAESGGH